MFRDAYYVQPAILGMGPSYQCQNAPMVTLSNRPMAVKAEPPPRTSLHVPIGVHDGGGDRSLARKCLPPTPQSSVSLSRPSGPAAAHARVHLQGMRPQGGGRRGVLRPGQPPPVPFSFPPHEIALRLPYHFQPDFFAPFLSSPRFRYEIEGLSRLFPHLFSTKTNTLGRDGVYCVPQFLFIHLLPLPSLSHLMRGRGIDR